MSSFSAFQMVEDISLAVACRDGKEVCHFQQIFQQTIPQHIPPYTTPQSRGRCQENRNGFEAESIGRFPDTNTAQKGIFQGKDSTGRFVCLSQ